jgi:hypothetical protein
MLFVMKPQMRIVLSWSLSFAALACWVQAEEMNLPVMFSGGHETDQRDHGRPVVLVAGGLGVKPEVFREAFSNVHPAKREGGPTGEEARRNKEVLMKALGPHGITNDRLDDVSNYYRYQPQKGKLWPTTAAKAHAVVEDGKVKRIVVDEGGGGYSSTPTATVEGMNRLKLKVTLSFGKDLKKNGAVASIQVE